VRRHRLAHRTQDRDRLVRIGEAVPAPVGLAHFLHRAGEVDVDHVVVHPRQQRGGLAHLVRRGAHHLPGTGVIVEIVGRSERDAIVIQVAEFFAGKEWGV